MILGRYWCDVCRIGWTVVAGDVQPGDLRTVTIEESYRLLRIHHPDVRRIA